MQSIVFAILVFATASAGGTAQRTSEDSCTRFNCSAETGVTAGEMVNRNGKGDRLPVVPVLHRLSVKQPAKIEALPTLQRQQELSEGCESLASSLSRSSLANIAGRCLS
jgi:hypothetical protein